MSIDLDRITHPLRLARGSHQAGSGKGCAMNVISYINGDTVITDYPSCSAKPLAHLVQLCNDMLADPDDDLLSPENAVLVLDLGWSTVGTAVQSSRVLYLWMAELIGNPHWGAGRYLNSTELAELLRKRPKFFVHNHEWRHAVAAATHDRAQSSAHEHCKAAVGEFLYLNRCGLDDIAATCAELIWLSMPDGHAEFEFTKWAIQRWREIAGLDTQATQIQEADIDRALELIGV